MSNQLPEPSTLIPATVMNTPSPKDRETVKHRLAIQLRHTARLQLPVDEYIKETFPEPSDDGTIHILDGVSDRHLPLLIDLFFEFYQDLDKEFERTVRKDNSNFDKYSSMLDRKSTSNRPAKHTVKKALSPKEKLLAKQAKLREQQAELEIDDDAIEKEMRAKLGL